MNLQPLLGQKQGVLALNLIIPFMEAFLVNFKSSVSTVIVTFLPNDALLHFHLVFTKKLSVFCGIDTQNRKHDAWHSDFVALCDSYGSLLLSCKGCRPLRSTMWLGRPGMVRST